MINQTMTMAEYIALKKAAEENICLYIRKRCMELEEASGVQVASVELNTSTRIDGVELLNSVKLKVRV